MYASHAAAVFESKGSFGGPPRPSSTGRSLSHRLTSTAYLQAPHRSTAPYPNKSRLVETARHLLVKPSVAGPKTFEFSGLLTHKMGNSTVDRITHCHYDLCIRQQTFHPRWDFFCVKVARCPFNRHERGLIGVLRSEKASVGCSNSVHLTFRRFVIRAKPEVSLEDVVLPVKKVRFFTI